MDNNLNQDIWQQPVNPMPEQPKKPNYDVPALVLGIVSAIFAFVSSCFICCAPIPLVTGIIGIVFVKIADLLSFDIPIIEQKFIIKNTSPTAIKIIAICDVFILFIKSDTRSTPISLDNTTAIDTTIIIVN